LSTLAAGGINVPAACAKLYYLAFPLDFVVSAGIHVALNFVFPPKGLSVIDEVHEFGTFTLDEGQKLGVLPPVIQSDMQTVDDLQRPEDEISVALK